MPPPRTSTEAEIQALEDVCQRLAAFDDTVSLEWLDGYMTALLAGPRRLEPAEWLDRVCEGVFARTYGDPDDAAPALAAINARWAVLANQLDPEQLLEEPDALRLAPLMLELSDEDKARLVEEGHVQADELHLLELTGEVWAQGFLDATHDYADDWPEADTETDEGRAYDHALMCVVLLAMHDAQERQETIDELFPEEELTRDDLIHEACYAAQDLRLYWLDHAPRPPQRRVDPLPGRNDLCPCGSGKKFKKCHGAQLH